MGDFRKKKFLHRKKIYLSWRIMLERNLTPLYVREKIISPEV